MGWGHVCGVWGEGLLGVMDPTINLVLGRVKGTGDGCAWGYGQEEKVGMGGGPGVGVVGWYLMSCCDTS